MGSYLEVESNLRLANIGLFFSANAIESEQVERRKQERKEGREL